MILHGGRTIAEQSGFGNIFFQSGLGIFHANRRKIALFPLHSRMIYFAFLHDFCCKAALEKRYWGHKQRTKNMNASQIQNLKPGAVLLYNDGRPGHSGVQATVLSADARGMTVQFEDQADTTRIQYSEAAWMDYLTIAPDALHDEPALTPAQKAWATRRANAAEPASIPATDGSAHHFNASEYKAVCLRETPLPDDLQLCDVPAKAAEFWRKAIASDPRHKGDVESVYVIFLNTRRKIIGYSLISNGTLDTILVHPREVFRSAIVAGAAAIVLMHNHPSGESSPGEGDIKATRNLIRAGQIIQIEVLDHVVIGAGNPGFTSLRELGYFAI